MGEIKKKNKRNVKKFIIHPFGSLLDYFSHQRCNKIRKKCHVGM